MKLSPVMKITTAAMLMGLAIIFNKLLVIQIPPFIRIGIAAVPIMMSSVLLGPVYGFFVGAIADVLGYFMFDTSNFPYSPFVTISFVILGVLPYFLLMLTRKLRYQKHPIPYSYVLMGAIWTFLLVFILMNDSVTVSGHTYQIDLLWKILIPIISAVVFGFFTWFIYYLNRRFQKKVLDYPSCPSPHEIAFMVLLLHILVNIVWGSFWKSIFFQMDFMTIFFVQSIILIFSFPIDTMLLTTVFMTYYRYVDKARSNKVE